MLKINSSDAEVYSILVNKIREIIASEERIGWQELPSYFNGFTSELLYNQGANNAALVLLINELVVNVDSKGKDELIERLKPVDTVLSNIYDRYQS